MIIRIFVITVCILLDILTKYWANLINPQFKIIGDFLQITHVKNDGIAFGTPLPRIQIIIPIILIVIGIYLWKSWKIIGEIERIGLLMILTGGGLNALERAGFGSVTDFIAVQYFSVFNVADIAVTAGVILLILGEMLNRKRKA